jgi:hypothetical protein
MAEKKKINPGLRNPGMAKKTSSIPPAPKANNPVAGNVGIIIFFALLVISYFVFISNFYSIKDLVNPYLKSKVSWLIPFQFMLYTIIYGLFGYFGFRWLKDKDLNKISKIMALVSFIGIIIIHSLAYNKAFEDVDDNASYMIAAKSLVDKGAPYYLYMPEVKPDTEGAIGLPLMLVPLYKIWGMNYVPMEYLIFIIMAASVVVCFLFFKQMEGPLFAVMAALLYATHPYIVSFSSIIMTEIPYIFWSLLGLYLCLKFEQKEKLNWWLLIAVTVSIFMTYLTRAIGIGFIAAAVLYFLIKSRIWTNIKEKKMPFYKDVAFIRFVLISALLFVFVVIYQLWTRSLGGASQAEALAKMSLADQFSKNFGLVWEVLSQNIFAGKLARFEVNPKYLEPVNFLWGLVFLITFAGLIFSLFKKQLIALYFIFVMFMLLIGNVATQNIVISRYLIVFTPMFIYFLYFGIKSLIKLVDKKEVAAKAIAVGVLAILLGNSFIGDAFNIQRSTKEKLYIEPYQAFLDCAVWAKDNLPKDAIVGSRKERIFYIFSDGVRGYKHISSNELSRMREQNMTMDDFEKNKLEQIAKNKTDYLIVDTFNSASVQLILPIIQKNPDKFKLEKTIGDEKTGPCFVFKIIKWWS